MGGRKPSIDEDPSAVADAILAAAGIDVRGVDTAQASATGRRPPPASAPFVPVPETTTTTTIRTSRAVRYDVEHVDVVVLAAGEAVETLRLAWRSGLRPALVLLDPPYQPEEGQPVASYRRWLLVLLRAAARLADHVIIWGEPTTLGALAERVPKSHELRGGITWVLPNAVRRLKTWRPGHQMCLHLARPNAKMHVENSYNAAQERLAHEHRLVHQPTPTTVIDAALVPHSHRRHEHEKPADVLGRLILMTTAKDDLVVDPCCGSGSTGEMARELGRRALLCDHDDDVVEGVAGRLVTASLRYQSVNPSKSDGRSGARYPSVNPSKSAPSPEELEGRRRRAVEACGKGERKAAVARRLGVSRQAVASWVKDGPSGLAAVQRRGRTPKLNKEQIDSLRSVVAATPTFWSGPKLAAYIQREFGIAYHVDTALRLLRRLCPELKD